MGAKHFGARVLRLEDPVLLTGRGRFVGDMTMPGMLHASFVRSTMARARITRIGTEDAVALDGVRAVLTAEDVNGDFGGEYGMHPRHSARHRCIDGADFLHARAGCARTRRAACRAWSCRRRSGRGQ